MAGFDNKLKGRYDARMENYDNEDVTNGGPDDHTHYAFNDFEVPGESEPKEPWRQNTDEEEAPVQEAAPAEPAQEVKENKPWPLPKDAKLGRRNIDARIHTKGKHVEALLNELGWGGDTYTTEVANEVKQIQEENGLVPSGRVDALTWNVIFNNR